MTEAALAASANNLKSDFEEGIEGLLSSLFSWERVEVNAPEPSLPQKSVKPLGQTPTRVADSDLHIYTVLKLLIGSKAPCALF